MHQSDDLGDCQSCNQDVYEQDFDEYQLNDQVYFDQPSQSGPTSLGGGFDDGFDDDSISLSPSILEDSLEAFDEIEAPDGTFDRMSKNIQEGGPAETTAARPTRLPTTGQTCRVAQESSAPAKRPSRVLSRTDDAPVLSRIAEVPDWVLEQESSVQQNPFFR
jgi:hypothetical protein